MSSPNILAVPETEADARVIVDALVEPFVRDVLAPGYGESDVVGTISNAQAMRIAIAQEGDALSATESFWGTPHVPNHEQADIVLAALRHQASMPGHRTEASDVLTRVSPDPVERVLRGVVVRFATHYLNRAATA